MNVDQRTGTASAEPRSIETLGRPDPMALPPPPESIVNMYELTFRTFCAGIFIKKGAKGLAWLFGGVFAFLQVSPAYLHQETCHLLFWTRTSEKVEKSTRNLESKKSSFPNAFSGGVKHKKTLYFFFEK